MDLAKYCVNAVLVEGRSIRAVAGATGTSKTWVHRQVSLFRSGGDEALILKKHVQRPRPTSSIQPWRT
jgi:transposase